MAEGVKPRIKLPKVIKAGEPATIKTLISHKMESGQRVDDAGLPIPRSIIHRFQCSFDGETIVDIEMQPAVATNPFFEFTAAFPANGTLVFTWYDDDGSIYETSKDVVVS